MGNYSCPFIAAAGVSCMKCLLLTWCSLPIHGRLTSHSKLPSYLTKTHSTAAPVPCSKQNCILYPNFCICAVASHTFSPTLNLLFDIPIDVKKIKSKKVANVSETISKARCYKNQKKNLKYI
jgi:hypothetical protein